MAFKGINRRLAPRSIRVIISPTPSTFAERRSILQVLKQYGKIDTFKREDHRANRYLSITRLPETANSLVNMSPIACRVSLPRIEHDKRARQLQSLAQTMSRPKIDIKPRAEGDDARPWDSHDQNQNQNQQQHMRRDTDADNFETREFEVTIVPAHDYDHGVAATAAMEYPRWPAGYKADKSFAAVALQDALPESLVKEGLKHWHVNPTLGNSSDTMRQRLERKHQVPGHMAANPLDEQQNQRKG